MSALYLTPSSRPRLSLSRKSLIGRLMLAFSLLALLLLLLVTLGSLSLHWVQQADKYLYDKALPASEAARQLVLSSNALAENAKLLGQSEFESQRQLVGRKLSINSAAMLNAIGALKALNVNFDLSLEQSASDIILDLSRLGEQVGQRILAAYQLQLQGKALVDASNESTDLLLAELAIVDSGILSKISLAYPQAVGVEQTSKLLDTLIEQDLDIQERLNRALKIVHNIALMGQVFQSPELDSGIFNSLAKNDSQLRELGVSISGLNDPASDAGLRYFASLTSLSNIIRDPVRSKAFARQVRILQTLPQSILLQKQHTQLNQAQELKLQALTDKLDALNGAVDTAMNIQRVEADKARVDYLNQLSWSKVSLLLTGLLMLLVIAFVVYKVIYQGIALKLNAATTALAQLSLGNTAVTIDTEGDDELAAMASAIKAFKQKTEHNLKLQAELRDTATELFEHKQALEATVEARTLELAEANVQLDKEAKGHVLARDMAEQANQAKSLFLATMSHEIRTPLNGLLGTLTLLGHSKLPPSQRQMLALSQYSGTLLQTLLNDILDFSRLEQSKLANEPRAVDLAELLDEVTAIMLAGAGLAGLTLVANYKNLPKWVYLDGPKLRQVLFNLLGNSIKFTPQGTVELSVMVEQGALAFKVQDSGVGIDCSAMTKLFKAYSNEPSKGRDRGTGLGLAISKQLVELMSAGAEASKALWVTSQVTQGSSFGFSLPLTECVEPDMAQQLQAVLVSSKRVLVVEDNKINAMVAQGFLAHLGHDSVLATSCEAARQAYTTISASDYDAVMLDIQLGDGSGMTLLEELQQINAQIGHSLPIAAFTAQLQVEDMENYQQQGFDLVLMKPLDMKALTAWLGRAKEIDELNATPEAASQTTAIAPLLETAPGSKAMPNVNLALLDGTLLTQDMSYLGKEAVVELFELYRGSSQAHMATLAAAPKDFERILHALKGSSASMGLTQLATTCGDIEQLKVTAEEYLQQHQQLLALWQRSMEALSLWLDEQEEAQ
ncbi:TMAO reductase system sensor histidine kinase/response regulator TorS [Shewanella sp. GutDb-MelDb]|uniref:TMAO reductase system sensor histidine kinase/response regulator TorS n=1 Tax=Shewanella sp. GutDb-MelDb TaxID=2058316 RepID=UPI0027E3F70F|nr:TMAO reductase system sensor histidine kinase/response regulator TorS [Shewanella sp. GutDb-MelDb]